MSKTRSISIQYQYNTYMNHTMSTSGFIFNVAVVCELSAEINYLNSSTMFVPAQCDFHLLTNSSDRSLPHRYSFSSPWWWRVTQASISLPHTSSITHRLLYCRSSARNCGSLFVCINRVTCRTSSLFNAAPATRNASSECNPGCGSGTKFGKQPVRLLPVRSSSVSCLQVDRAERSGRHTSIGISQCHSTNCRSGGSGPQDLMDSVMWRP